MEWYFWLLIFMILFGIVTIIFFGWVGYRIKKAQKEGREEGIMEGKRILSEAKSASQPVKKQKASSGATYKKKPKK